MALLGAIVVFAVLGVITLGLGLGLYSLIRQQEAASRTVTDRGNAEQAARRDVEDP